MATGGINKLLNPNGFIKANKVIIKECGLHEAILLGSLCSRQDWWNEHWDVNRYGKFDGFFFCTAEELEEETTLSPHLQRKAFKTLEDKNIIMTSLRGLPSKKYFRINEKELAKLFFLEPTSCKPDSNLGVNEIDSFSQSDSNLGANEVDSNKNKNNKNKDNNKSYSEEIKEIIDYLNKKTSKQYRSTTEANNKLIRGRLREGYTVVDFKKVIDIKCADWLGGNYEKYLKPSTLFAPSHFEDYLNQMTANNCNQTIIRSERFNPIEDETFGVF